MARSVRCGRSARRDAGVVVEEIPLRDLELGPEELVEVVSFKRVPRIRP